MTLKKAYKWQTSQRGKPTRNPRKNTQQDKGRTRNNDDDTDLTSSVSSSSISSQENDSPTLSNPECLTNKKKKVWLPG